MGNQQKGKGAWGGTAKSSGAKKASAQRLSNQKSSGSPKFKNNSNPHGDGRKPQSGKQKPW